MGTDKIEIAKKHLKMISSVGEKLSNIGCESSIYSLDDDEFGDVMFMRHLADLALREIENDNEEDDIKISEYIAKRCMEVRFNTYTFEQIILWIKDYFEEKRIK